MMTAIQEDRDGGGRDRGEGRGGREEGREREKENMKSVCRTLLGEHESPKRCQSSRREVFLMIRGMGGNNPNIIKKIKGGGSRNKGALAVTNREINLMIMRK